MRITFQPHGHQAVGVMEACSVGELGSYGDINRLLDGCCDVCEHFRDSTIQLCGQRVVTSQAFTNEPRRTFLLLRQTLNDLDLCTDAEEQSRVLTQQSVQFLTFLQCYVHRFLSTEDGLINSEAVAEEITTQLSVLCRHMGPLKDLLSMLRRDNPTPFLAHVMLHVHWTTLIVLYRLTGLLGPGRLVSCASAVISSCLAEAAMTFDLSPMSFLPCPCVGNMWLLLRAILDSQSSLTKAFWDVLFDQLTPLLQSSTEHAHNMSSTEHAQNEYQECSLTTTHPIVFIWWTLSQLAKLDRGTDLLSMPSNWTFVHQHLLPLTYSGQLSEVKVRVCLEYGVRLMTAWGLSTQLLFKAWEYTHRHMNDQPTSVHTSIVEWAPNRDSSTPLNWTRHILKITNFADETTPSEWSTFELFLHMLARVLGSHGNGQSLWKQFKGRVYSKVHGRWINELSTWGLGRLISLYLTLTLTADLREVSDKMVSVLLSTSRDLTLVWKGLFALVLIHLHNNSSVAALVDKLTPPLCNLIGQFQSCDSLWSAVAVVLDGTLEAIEYPNAVQLDICNLIGGHWSKLLSMLEGPRLSKLLSVIDNIGNTLSGYSDLPMLSCRGYLDHCILALPTPTLTQSHSHPHTLHSTAAAGTLLALQWPRVKDQAQQVFTEFACKDDTHPYVASGYLCHVLSNPLMCRELVSTEHAQFTVLHTWLRTVIQCHAHPLPCDSHVTELTRLVPTLSLVTRLLNGQEPSGDPITLLKLILSLMQARHVSDGVTSVWRDCVGVVLGDLVKVLQPCLNAGAKSMRSAYSVSGVVLARCPLLVYSRIDSRCLLPRLIDSLVLPIATSKTPATDLRASCIRNTLHHFVDGLLQLSPEQDDFIKRKIRQIFTRYFLRYCQPSHPLTASTSNPFKTLLTPWCDDSVSTERAQQWITLLDTVTSLFLQLPCQPATLLPVLVYIRELVEGVRSRQLLETTTHCLLPSLLPCLLACDVCSTSTEPRGIRKQVMTSLRVLLRSCDTSQTHQLMTLVCQFVDSNIAQGKGAVLRTVGAVLDLHPSLTTPTLEHLDHTVSSLEDQTLRNSYQQLKDRLKQQ